MSNILRTNIQERIPKVIYRLVFMDFKPDTYSCSYSQSKNEKGLQVVRAVLFNLGFTQEDLVVSSVKDQCAIELFDEARQKLLRIKKLFSKLNIPGIKVTLSSLAPKDWLTKWKSQWKPAALTKNLDVVPVWCQKRYKPQAGRNYILMDTLLSFGTGLHETTRFMAQFIENKKGQFSSFLDIGTGTGILAFVAMKCGAEDVVGIDIGPLSIQAARSNMDANQTYFSAVKADVKKYRLNKVFDFVAANLITEDLIDNSRKIASFVKDNGFLAVSGISLGNLERLQKSYSNLPLKCLKVSKGEQWSGILYQKRTS